MKPLADQIEYLQSECKKNKVAFELIRSEFGERKARLVASPLLSQVKNYETIITSLMELNRIKKGK